MNWITGIFKKQSEHEAKASPAPPKPAAPTAGNDDITLTLAQPLVTCQQNLTVEQLKHFAPLRGLDEATLVTIPHTTLLFAKDSVLFQRGQPSNSVYYLLEGSVAMQPDGPTSYKIQAGTSLAALPLNSGNRFGATATTLTDATIIKLSANINKLWSSLQPDEGSYVELVDIELPSELSDSSFFSSFAQAYRDNKLSLPSLPDVALRLKKAMEQDIGINEAVDIIHIDPPVVAKLIQVANSPLYASTVPVTNCHEAVNRIGLNATRSLVFSLSMKQLFQAKDRELMKGMHQLWLQSLYVSCLCFVLAQECSNINPEDALLAGLVCDIGAIPLLHFAEQFPERYPSLSELEAAMPFLRGPVGSLVLHTLGFSTEMSNIPNLAENWLYAKDGQLELADIVILAKLHSYFGRKKTKGLPFINSIPAYAKIGKGTLNPDFSLTVLQKAQSRIKATMQLMS